MTLSAEQVVLLQVGSDWEDIEDVLDDPDKRGWAAAGDSSFRVNIRQPVASKQTSRLCLIAKSVRLVAVGLIRAERRSGDLDTLIRVDELHRLSIPIDMSEVIEDLPARFTQAVEVALATTAVLGDRTATELLRSLAGRSSEFADTSDRLRRLLRSRRPTGELSQATVELHDATALGLRLAGFKSGTIASREPNADTTPRGYFARMESIGRDASEAAMIRHDAQNFGDWIPSPGRVLDVVEFTDPTEPSRRVTVLYADKEAEERVTGADLIYYREHFPAFVLVQYKRMRKEVGDSVDRYGYRPDRQLTKELQRMRRILSAAPGRESNSKTSSDSWRLLDQPFYVKLVQSGRARPGRGDLLPGMYFPIDLFEIVLRDPVVRGHQHTKPIGWHNAGRWLNNTEFLELMKAGWIGSSGVATEYLKKVIAAVWESGQSVLVVRDQTPGGPHRSSI